MGYIYVLPSTKSAVTSRFLNHMGGFGTEYPNRSGSARPYYGRDLLHAPLSRAGLVRAFDGRMERNGIQELGGAIKGCLRAGICIVYYCVYLSY